MCGIAGILSFNSKVEKTQIKQLTDVLAHRGPDGEGQWVNVKSNIGLGHRRLSIIDLSENASQPMHYADGRYTISYNGEIYNYLELKLFLQNKGFVFKTESDTEVLLAMYHYKGVDFLKDLDGMFAFAIWDEQEQELFCARDRFGEKPFFYSLDQNRFVFGSEIKALWKADIKKKIQNSFIYNYLLFGTVEDINLPEQTIYNGVYKLEPGHFLKINAQAKLYKEQYWKVDLEHTNKDISIEKAKEQFLDLFTESVKLRLRSDVTVGSSLSGGLDSSSIVTMIDRIKGSRQEQKTFSARFKDFAKDEGYYIQKVLENAQNVKGFEVFPTEDSLIKNWNKIVHHQDEPFGSFSIAAQYEVMALAKQNQVTVLLDGQGADELMAGYSPYFNTYYSQLNKANKALYKKELKAFEELNAKAFGKLGFKTKFRQSNKALFNYVGGLKRSYTKATHDYFVGLNPEIVKDNKREKPPIASFTTLKEHLYYSSFIKGLPELLRYADRNAMASSVEVRLPFLSHKLVEFLFSLPDHMLIYNAWTKYILRSSMEDILPDEITWRKDKIGYEPPQNQWVENVYYKERIASSIETLKQEKIIDKVCPDLHWRYMMLSEYLKN